MTRSSHTMERSGTVGGGVALGLGQTSSAYPGTAKVRLKEVVDQKARKPLTPEDISYLTYPCEQGGFRATVTIAAVIFGLEEPLKRTGDVRPSKKDAEHSAASAALDAIDEGGWVSPASAGAASTCSTPAKSSVTESLHSSCEEDLRVLAPELKSDVAPQVLRILLTGGPCGAKSTALEMLKEVLPTQGVVNVHTLEDFTPMVTDEVDMATDIPRRRRVQQEREEQAHRRALRSAAEKGATPTVLLIDRGLAERALETDGPVHAPEEVLHRYDLVVHLMSPAVDKPMLYERIAKRGKPPKEEAVEEDIRIRRSYQRHANFRVLWNGPDKGQAIPVFLGWKLRALLRVVLKNCSTLPTFRANEQSSDGSAVDKWLRSRQLRESFGQEQNPGNLEVRVPLTKLLQKHFKGGREEDVKTFFDHVRLVCPLEDIRSNMPDFLRAYVEHGMPEAIGGAGSLSCAEKEKAAGKPERVAKEILDAYREAFRGEPPPVGTYLDVGSGTCTTASALAKKLTLPRDRVWCLDIEESCGTRTDDVTFRSFDGEKLPLASSSVELITFIHVLHHVEPGGSSMFQLLREVHRVLKPGGVVVVKEHNSPSRDYDLYLEAMHSLKQLVFYANEPEKMPLGSYQSVEEWKVTFRGVGLPVIHVADTRDIYNSVLLVLEKIPEGGSDTEA